MTTSPAQALRLKRLAYLRTLLVLGRVSNLPTVWSNCLAGWALGGSGSAARFVLLTAGATFLYVGGMFLNDACDAEFDRQHRNARPIPSGAIGLPAVWQWGIGWLVIGWLCVAALGPLAAILAIFLTACILVYDVVHKAFAFSPIIMAGCRFLLYLVAAAAATDGLNGDVIWSAFALAVYVVGISYIARKETIRGVMRFWPCYCLAAPALLALLINGQGFFARGVEWSAVLAIWTIISLRHTFWQETVNVGLTVSGLLAGIVLVDIVAVAGAPLWLDLVFLTFFATALFFQRFIPAT